jgi:hypothetical protein
MTFFDDVQQRHESARFLSIGKRDGNRVAVDRRSKSGRDPMPLSYADDSDLTVVSATFPRGTDKNLLAKSHAQATKSIGIFCRGAASHLSRQPSA